MLILERYVEQIFAGYRNSREPSLMCIITQSSVITHTENIINIDWKGYITHVAIFVNFQWSN